MSRQRPASHAFLRLLWSTAWLSAALAVSDAFVTPYLWLNRVTSAHLMLFLAVQFLAMSALFGLAGTVLTWPARRWMQTGTLLIALFLGSIVLGRTALHRYVYLFGAFLGLGFGAYWQGFYVGASDMVPPPERDWFNGRLGLVEGGASLAGPLLGAALLRLGFGFTPVFFVSLAGLVPVLMFIPGRVRAPASRAAPATDVSVLQRSWRWFLTSMAGRGAYEGILMAVPGLVLFERTRSSSLLALFTSLVALASLVGNWWGGRRSETRLRRRLTWAAAGVMTAATLALAIIPGPVGLFLYGVVMGFASPFQKIPLEACSLDLIHHAGGLRHRETALKELVLNLARALGLVLAAVVVGHGPGIPGLHHTLWLVPGFAILTAVTLSEFPALHAE